MHETDEKTYAEHIESNFWSGLDFNLSKIRRLFGPDCQTLMRSVYMHQGACVDGKIFEVVSRKLYCIKCKKRFEHF